MVHISFKRDEDKGLMEISTKTFRAIVTSLAQLELRIRLIEDPNDKYLLGKNKITDIKDTSALDFLMDKAKEIK